MCIRDRDNALMGSQYQHLVFQVVLFAGLHIPPLIQIAAVHARKIGSVIDNDLSLIHIYVDSLVRLEKVTVFYGGKKALGPVSLSVERGERVALRGRNGCGKSTLLKLIQQEPLDYTGTQQIPAGLILSTVPQDPSFLQGDLREFVRREGLDESLFKAVLRKLEFSRAQFDKAMQHFSAGQKKKVLLAKSLCQSAHLYLWDEMCIRDRRQTVQYRIGGAVE